MSEADYANRPQLMRIAMTKLVPKWDPMNWAPAMAALATAGRDLPEALANTAEAAARLSQRLGRVLESPHRWATPMDAGMDRSSRCCRGAKDCRRPLALSTWCTLLRSITRWAGPTQLMRWCAAAAALS